MTPNPPLAAGRTGEHVVVLVVTVDAGAALRVCTSDGNGGRRGGGAVLRVVQGGCGGCGPVPGRPGCARPARDNRVGSRVTREADHLLLAAHLPVPPPHSPSTPNSGEWSRKVLRTCAPPVPRAGGG